MLTEEEIKSLLNDAIRDCIAVGNAYKKIDSYSSLPSERNLKEVYAWTAVTTLCAVLETDDCKVWNSIVKECPNLGRITECSEL